MLDLLDSERSRLDVRLLQARDTADYLVALANLERAIGAAFPDAHARTASAPAERSGARGAAASDP